MTIRRTYVLLAALLGGCSEEAAPTHVTMFQQEASNAPDAGDAGTDAEPDAEGEEPCDPYGEDCPPPEPEPAARPIGCPEYYPDCAPAPAPGPEPEECDPYSGVCEAPIN